jgi:hypothetical protein
MKRQKSMRTQTGNAQNESKDTKAVCIFSGMVAAYAIGTPKAGFGLASLIFIGAGIAFFGEKDKRAIIAIPLATLLFVYGFFIYFLNVGIPFFPEYFIP